MIFLKTFTTFLEQIISFPDFKTSSASLKQQIKHLLFLANIANTDDWEAVTEEHNMILDDVKNGVISWDDAEYFTLWQSKMLQLVHFSTVQTETDCDMKEEELEIVDNVVQLVKSESENVPINTTRGNIEIKESTIGPEPEGISDEKHKYGVKGWKSQKKIVEAKEVRRLPISNVHKEFIQTKIRKNITSKCKHCDTQFPHKLCR